MKKRAWTVAVSITAGMCVLAGCNGSETGLNNSGGTTADPNATFLKSTVARDSTPEVAAADLALFTAGNREFAFDLYQVLRSQPGNLFYSPYSISAAIAMVYGGARTTTESEIAAAFHFDLGQNGTHPAFNKLDLELGSRGQGAQGADGGAFRLHVVNATWGQKGYPFLGSYLDLLAVNYGAGLRVLDFMTAAEACRVTINGWVADNTEQRITDLIPQGALDAATTMVLTNAIYFNAAWADQFDSLATADDTFTTAGGEVAVKMMRGGGELMYAVGTGFQAVEIPYDGNELSMIIVLPDAGAFDAAENAMSAGVFDAAVASLAIRRVNLKMPRFKIEGASFSLVDMLKALGMTRAFSGGDADFSGIDGTRNLFISDVIHKAFINVNEQGTEAAAATAVIVSRTSMPVEPPVDFTVDRPFVFAIRDRPTGAVLFMGRIADPSVQ